MGTRGLFAFKKGNKEAGTYNHFDSYPSCKGSWFLEFLYMEGAQEAAERFIKLKSYKDSMDSEKFTHEMTVKVLNSVEHRSNWMTFIRDSLFCEWAYIWNMDEKVLEVYKGFQEKRPAPNRYCKPHTRKNRDGYYPCALIAKLDLNEDFETNKVKLLALDA